MTRWRAICKYTGKETKRLGRGCSEIFGIRTSEYDKLQIVESLSSKTDLNKDFAFWQAEYDESQQRIRIRPKKFWKC